MAEEEVKVGSELCIGSIGQDRCQICMQTMGAAVDQNLRTRKTDKRQITDQVQKLMAHRFIGVAQGGIHPMIAITDEGIIECPPLNQAGCTELVHLLSEAEGAGRRDFRNEALRRQRQSTLLTTDCRLREINHANQRELLSGSGRDHAAAAVEGDRLLEQWSGRCRC